MHKPALSQEEIQQAMITITPIRALQDNYIWLIINQNQHCIIVDPSDAKPVLEYLEQKNLIPVGILITHHHTDHTAGICAIIKQFEVKVYGGTLCKNSYITYAVNDNNLIIPKHMKLELTVIATPGHTKDHVAYYGNGTSTSFAICETRSLNISPARSKFAHGDSRGRIPILPLENPPSGKVFRTSAKFVMSGDTLFAAGCGRIFEGTAQEMYNSLSKLASLPDDTLIYCAHEYTLNNLKFAQLVEPNNPIIHKRIIKCQQLLQQKLPTLPSTIGLEKATNPFLRCNQPDIIAAAQKHSRKSPTDPAEIFRILREWKNHF